VNAPTFLKLYGPLTASESRFNAKDINMQKMTRSIFRAMLMSAFSVLVCNLATAQTAKPTVPAAAAPTPAAAPVVAAAPPAVTTPAPASADNLPKHSCKQPDRPGQFSTENEQRVFIKAVDTYRDCLMAFRSEMNEKAKASVEAGNKAVEEFNAFAESLRKR
jgi:hypothetical protein